VLAAVDTGLDASTSTRAFTLALVLATLRAGASFDDVSPSQALDSLDDGLKDRLMSQLLDVRVDRRAFPLGVDVLAVTP
jgi:hypothetical protein